MKKQFLFTRDRLNDIQAPDSGRVEFFDTKQQKLRLRVTQTGIKSFSVVKKVNGKLKRVTIGRWPEVSIAKAREDAINILDKLRQGIDPTAEKRKQLLQSSSLEKVLELYLNGRDLKPYTVKDYRYKLRLGFKDWLNKPVSDITENMIIERHKKLSKKGNTTANTNMRVLRLTLNYATAVGMIDRNPTEILSKARLWHKNKRKERLIPSNSLSPWLSAVETLDNQKAKLYLKMALYMGYRSSELLSLRWSDIDFETKTIMLRDTKNRTNHSLPIPKVLQAELISMRELTGEAKWVFAGANPAKPMSIPTKPIRHVIKKSGVEFSPHDCRRTFATIAEAVNLPMSMIKRLMNHVVSNDVTGGYIVTEDETLRVAINKIADFIQRSVRRPTNVVSLHG